MAKLLQPFMGAVQPLRAARTPAQEMQRGNLIQSTFEDIASVSRRGMNYAQQLEQEEASTNMSIEYSKAYNEILAEPYISMDRAIELGADDGEYLYEKDDDGNLNPRQEIPVWEILPDVAKKKYDKLTERYAEKISGGGHRQEWVNRRKVAGEEMYSNLIAAQREEYFNQKVADADFAMEEARRLGDYGLMSALAQTYPVVEKREALTQEVRSIAEQDGLHRALQTQDPETMMQMAEWLRDPENPSTLSEQEQTAWIQTLQNTARSLVTTSQNKILEEADQLRVLYETQLAMEDPSALITLSQIQRTMSAAGDPHYFGKAWFAREVGKMTTMQMEWQKKREIAAAFNAAPQGGYATLDVFDPDTRDTLDEYAVRTIGQAAEEGGPAAAHQRMVEVIHKSAAAGYLPQYFKTQLNMLNSPAISPEHARTVAGIYEAVMASNQMLFKDMDDKTLMMAGATYNMVRSGVDVNEGIKQLRMMFASRTPDEMQALDREVTQYLNKETTPNAGMLESKVRQAKGTLAERLPIINALYSDLSTMGVGRTMQTAYDNLTKQYFIMNGGDLELAQDAAFTRLINTWQVSNVNGSKQYMRDAPEFAYNLPADEIRGDFHRWMGEISEDFNPEEKGNYILQPDLRTHQEHQPSYAVFKISPTGMPVPVTVNNGAHLRYRPRTKEILKRNKLQEVLVNRRRREIESLGDYKYEKLQSNETPQGNKIPRLHSNLWNPKRAQQRATEREEEKQTEQQSRMKVVEERAQQMASDREVMKDTGLLNE